jgi:hypothetical protein
MRVCSFHRERVIQTGKGARKTERGIRCGNFLFGTVTSLRRRAFPCLNYAFLMKTCRVRLDGQGFGVSGSFSECVLASAVHAPLGLVPRSEPPCAESSRSGGTFGARLPRWFSCVLGAPPVRNSYSAGESSDGRLGMAHATTATSRIPPCLLSGGGRRGFSGYGNSTSSE